MTQDPEPQNHRSASPIQSASTEQRFVLRLLQAITRWSPIAGTSFAFASFLLQQEWVMAGLLFGRSYWFGEYRWVN